MVWRFGQKMTIKINFLAPKEATYFYLYDFKVQVPVFLVMAGIILFLWHMVLHQRIDAEIKHGNYLQQELQKVIAKIDEKIKTSSNPRADKEKEITNLVATLGKKRASFVQVFMALHQGMSDGLYFTQILIKNGEVKLIGQARSMANLMRLITSFTAAKYGSRTPAIQKITRQEGGYGFSLFFY